MWTRQGAYQPTDDSKFPYILIKEKLKMVDIKKLAIHYSKESGIEENSCYNFFLNIQDTIEKKGIEYVYATYVLMDAYIAEYQKIHGGIDVH